MSAPQNTIAIVYANRPGTHLRLLLEQMVEETANRIVAERRSAIETAATGADLVSAFARNA